MRIVDQRKTTVKISEKFGRLTVLGSSFYVGRRQFVVCECTCGNVVVVILDNIKRGRTRSCGCWYRETIATHATTHGLRRHPLYAVWCGMKGRCYNPASTKYYCYGARGITICDEWRNGFLAFYEFAVAGGWKSGLQIDRIDNDMGYSPENCRFVTGAVNMRNSRRVRNITAFGETKCQAEWARDPRFEVDIKTFFSRLSKGIPLELAMVKKS